MLQMMKVGQIVDRFYLSIMDKCKLVSTLVYHYLHAICLFVMQLYLFYTVSRLKIVLLLMEKAFVWSQTKAAYFEKEPRLQLVHQPESQFPKWIEENEE